MRLFLTALLLAFSAFIPQMPAMENSIHSDEESEYEDSYSFTGTLRPFLITKISSEVPGKIEKIFVEEGDAVEKDQVLAKLETKLFELELQKHQNFIALAKVNFEEAELEYNRMKSLWERGEEGKSAISKKQFEDADTRLKQKKILLQQALIDSEYCKKRMEETSIKAPYRGIITKRFVDPGESVTSAPLTHIFEIMDTTKLILEFSLPQNMLSLVKCGLSIDARIEGQVKTVEGKITKILPLIEPSNRSFKCQVVISNEKLQLKPGAFVTGKIIRR